MLNPLCQSSNLTDGRCTSCYPGYAIEPVSGNCLVSLKDPNCLSSSGPACTACADRFYLSVNSRCVQVNALCKGYNK